MRNNGTHQDHLYFSRKRNNITSVIVPTDNDLLFSSNQDHYISGSFFFLLKVVYVNQSFLETYCVKQAYCIRTIQTRALYRVHQVIFSIYIFLSTNTSRPEAGAISTIPYTRSITGKVPGPHHHVVYSHAELFGQPERGGTFNEIFLIEQSPIILFLIRS